MTQKMNVLLAAMVCLIVGGSLFFLFSHRPVEAIFNMLLGIFLMLVQIFVAIKTRP